MRGAAIQKETPMSFGAMIAFEIIWVLPIRYFWMNMGTLRLVVDNIFRESA